MSIVPTWCVNYTGNMTVYLRHYYCSKIEINLTSCEPVQTQEDMEAIRTLCEASEIVWYSVFWFSIVVGILGNALALGTIASLPVSIATFFVGLLAFSDLICVMTRMIIYFLNKEKLLNPTTPFWHIFPLFFDFSVSYSNWLLVLICLDRFITVRYPLQRRFYFTLRHARIGTFIMALVLFLIYFAAVQILGYKDTRMFTVRNLLYSLIPLIFISILIVLMAIQFRIIHKKRKFLQEGSGSQNGNGSNSIIKNTSPSTNVNLRYSERTNSTQNSLIRGSCQHNNHSQNQHQPRRSNVFEDIERLENNITIMMMVTAVCFAILTIPNCILLFTYRYAAEHWNTPLARARWHVFSKTSQVLTFLNLSINFLLYLLSASKFRHQLCQLLRIRKKKKKQNIPPNQMSSLLHMQTTSETYL